jgi:hypothetical protein
MTDERDAVKTMLVELKRDINDALVKTYVLRKSIVHTLSLDTLKRHLEAACSEAYALQVRLDSNEETGITPTV